MCQSSGSEITATSMSWTQENLLSAGLFSQKDSQKRHGARSGQWGRWDKTRTLCHSSYGITALVLWRLAPLWRKEAFGMLATKLWVLVTKLWVLVTELWVLVTKLWVLVTKLWVLVTELWVLVTKL